jgi:hypothetical protein
MLIVAGDGRGLPMDYDELERWTRVGYERGEVTQGRAVSDRPNVLRNLNILDNSYRVSPRADRNPYASCHGPSHPASDGGLACREVIEHKRHLVTNGGVSHESNTAANGNNNAPE